MLFQLFRYVCLIFPCNVKVPYVSSGITQLVQVVLFSVLVC
jgi:hypothetical protein